MKFARFFQSRYAEKFSVELADIASLPFYNQDIEGNPPSIVADFKQKIADANAVLIVTPEYNWSVSGVLKNALDWLSRVQRVVVGKPVLIAGVSPAMLGTVRAQMHLREILSAPGMGARMLPPGGNEILINQAADKFNDAGALVHEPTVEFLDSVVEKFVALVTEATTAK